ncbi:MAG: hypothetical protein MJK10_18960 [Pseudomonadales bacterium]|nr:hypothetical protein [Pseudomonadales bacterium]NRA18367.1 hypothetical protein [Oceanospirillaceae bacterium]
MEIAAVKLFSQQGAEVDFFGRCANLLMKLHTAIELGCSEHSSVTESAKMVLLVRA